MWANDSNLKSKASKLPKGGTPADDGFMAIFQV